MKIVAAKPLKFSVFSDLHELVCQHEVAIGAINDRGPGGGWFPRTASVTEASEKFWSTKNLKNKKTRVFGVCTAPKPGFLCLLYF